MTEHFTNEGMKELAGGIGISFHPRCFSDKNLTDLCNAAVNHKLKEWEAQEPVAKTVSLTTGIGLQWVGDPVPVGTALYTRALPAQPTTIVERYALRPRWVASRDLGAHKAEKELASTKAQLAGNVTIECHVKKDNTP